MSNSTESRLRIITGVVHIFSFSFWAHLVHTLNNLSSWPEISRDGILLFLIRYNFAARGFFGDFWLLDTNLIVCNDQQLNAKLTTAYFLALLLQLNVLVVVMSICLSVNLFICLNTYLYSISPSICRLDFCETGKYDLNSAIYFCTSRKKGT